MPQLEQTRAAKDLFVSVINQTSGLAGLLIVGPDSRAVMAKLCALQFHPREFPNLRVAQSSFAKVRATIIRNDLGELSAFTLYFARANGEYIWDTVLDAGGEFGMQPFGAAAQALLQESEH